MEALLQGIGRAESDAKAKEVKEMSFECEYFTVQGLQLAAWYATFWAVDVRQELGFMRDWLDANPRRRKKNYERFIVNWLKTEQRKAVAQQAKERKIQSEAMIGSGPQSSGGMSPEYIAKLRERGALKKFGVR